MSAEPLTVSVIGCGRMGRRRLEALSALDRVRLVSACDSDESAAGAAERDFRVPARRDWREALDDGADAVVVCLPNRLHAPVAAEALRRGRHVFCEKPLATTEEDARALVEAALRAGSTLAVGSNLRRFPNVAEAMRLHRAGAIGEVLSARAWIGHDGWNLATPWYRDAGQTGGGTLIDNGIHALDLLRWFLGEVVECTGLVDTARWTPRALGSRQGPRAGRSPAMPAITGATKEAGLEDNAMGVFRSESGRLASVHSSWTERGGYFQLEVNGAEGLLRTSCRAGGATLERVSASGRSETLDFSDRPPASCRDELAAWRDALRAGERPDPDGYDGLRAVQMALAIYASAQSGARSSLWTQADRELGRRVREWETSNGSRGSTATSTRAAAPSA